MTRELLTIEAAHRRFGISRRTIEVWIRDKVIEWTMLQKKANGRSGLIRVYADSIEKEVARHEPTNPHYSHLYGRP